VPARVQVLRRSPLMIIASYLALIQSQATYASKPFNPSVLYHRKQMPRSEKGKQSLRSRLLHATIPTAGLRNRSPSPSTSQRIIDPESATIVFTHQTVQLGFIPPPVPPDEIAKMNTPIPPLGNCASSTTQVIPPTARGGWTF